MVLSESHRSFIFNHRHTLREIFRARKEELKEELLYTDDEKKRNELIIAAREMENWLGSITGIEQAEESKQERSAEKRSGKQYKGVV